MSVEHPSNPDTPTILKTIVERKWQEIAEPDDQNCILVQVRCLLIETRGQRILVDTGYGDKLSDRERGFMRLDGKGRLLGSLAALGVEPQDIDIVINTHLHGDHCGGNTQYDDHGDLVGMISTRDFLNELAGGFEKVIQRMCANNDAEGTVDRSITNSSRMARRSARRVRPAK